MSIELVFKKEIRIGEDKTVLDTYLLQVTPEIISLGLLSGYTMAPWSTLFKMLFFHRVFLITSVYGLSGVFLLDNHSVLATLLIVSVGNTQWLS